ncbi:speckle targeted PIP5K1A-regulated poly(A) polymerase-like [Leptidea sinapis]|uniref:speckle targeted PIP5K1A-regulated poly(A) polymerase-like n=1 Tax=Leptidea sinapis TaxID=189913 RepID=UPI002127C560|nr:speckle targeted PIP5K1A-regulated poly(A) polymerase-like [Leptidea sinapis]
MNYGRGNSNNILDTTMLSLVGEFNTQVNEILGYVRLTRDDVLELQLLFDDLRAIFGKIWPGCTVEPFGSITTGLGIKTSDVDCYIGIYTADRPPPAACAQEARQLLRRHKHLFTKILAILKAKVPIVKFHYLPTRTDCDISFSSPASVYNSELVSHLLNMDERILPLTIIIKYWAKLNNLTGTNFMSNYCLSLLVLFYLQQREIVPPVFTLQQNVAPSSVDCWNMSFDTQEVYTTNNKETLYSLLGGFFQYYKNFAFNKYVISLYHGKVIDKELFRRGEMYSQFEQYYTNLQNKVCKEIVMKSPMCVQDPFNHSRNVAISVHNRLYINIMNCIRNASAVYDNEDVTDFLPKLLLNHPPNRPLKHMPNRNMNTNRGIAKNNYNKQKFGNAKIKQNIQMSRKYYQNQFKRK